MVDTIQINSPTDSYLGKYYTQLTLGEYSRPAPFTSSEFKTKKIIYFPLPVDLRDNTSVGYNNNNQNLESVGDIINGDSVNDIGPGLRAALARNSGELIKSTASNVLGAGVDAYFGGYSKFLGKIGGAIDKVISADQITSAIQQMTGTAPNPNPSVMFTGPELRDFSHSWTFYPKNETESNTLQKIIKVLKESALPKNTFAGSAALLNYPNMVQLNFYPWDTGGLAPWGWNSDTSIIRYKKCVMKGVSVNYTPGGSPGFFHGTNGAVATTITISFMEIEYMLSGDWDSNSGLDTLLESAQAITNAFPGATKAIKSAVQAVMDAKP